MGTSSDRGEGGSMDVKHTPTQPRFDAHVHIFLWVALVLVSTLPTFLFAVYCLDPQVPELVLPVCILMIVSFHVAFWFARRRCDADDISAWTGLLLITAYMSIGISGLYAIIAIFAAMIATLLMVAIGLGSVVFGGPPWATRKFRAVILWFSRNRMYQ